MATEHDNEFDFNAGTNVVSISFDYSGDHIVTKDQPWGGVTSDKGKIVIKAGRKGSEECAKWFRDYVQDNYDNMIHTSGGDNQPNELNFAIKGVLNLDGDLYQICLGQGHHNSENNWHLASTRITADSDAKNGTIGYRLNQNGSHAFDVTAGG